MGIMKLIFIRHPETEANVKKLIYGRTESKYSPKGEASVDWVLDQLSSKHIDRIYASPLKRAAYLAEKIAERHTSSLEVVLDERLMEMNFGDFENKTNDEARILYGDGFELFWNDFANFKIPNGETLGDVRDRITEFLRELKGKQPSDKSIEEMIKDDPIGTLEPKTDNEETIVIVAHSLVIRSAFSFLMNIPLEEIWHIDIKPASITEIIYRHNYGILSKLISPNI